ncbi:class I SAM-dependent methyltransferase [Paenibacillus alginolyticus]|uniref:Class I SAM-dependent methyltransferase n=1 Tax=Paenibacillus alginolyticus TaxID=59839 RepID=A0ABT4GPA1_9BACL|nr:class I SAM-dependent methyltransferase [Paenibacillus alginolyticus]MCY9698041.1 class I SAM-dependent methyltransferase [Paenibacillus alginolyticus]MEC0148831.1 class I SAM-dependent methyltransferase [Paenibacillus alginolyticus]
MGIEWYDMIARRNGGYKGRAVFTVEGKSAEEVFEERLINMLPNFKSVMDAGCGHGEFTLRMSSYARQITGFDNSLELINIAQTLLSSSNVQNVNFVYATTKTQMPFDDEEFDFIYDRRGPTSIINHSRLLTSGGVIFGIHTSIDSVKERLFKNGFKDIEIEELNEAISYFPNEMEFAKFLSDIPGNPDYTSPELKIELEEKIRENVIEGKLGVREHKYIWKAIKP